MEAPSYTSYRVRGLEVTRDEQILDADLAERIQKLKEHLRVFETAGLQPLATRTKRTFRKEAALGYYGELSEFECDIWKTYLDAHRDEPIHEVPDDVVDRLKEALELDCFGRFRIWHRNETDETMLLGIIDNSSVHPIIFWAPEGVEPPNPLQLRAHYELAEAAKAQKKAASEERAKESRRLQAAARQKALRLEQICWGTTLPVIALASVSFAFIVGWWAAVPIALMLYLAWIIKINGDDWNMKLVFRTICLPLLALCIGSTLVLGAVALQFGTSTRDLTLCSAESGYSYSAETHGYQTLGGEEYEVSRKAFEQILRRNEPSYVKVRATVTTHFFFGTPKIEAVSQVKDAYEACLRN